MGQTFLNCWIYYFIVHDEIKQEQGTSLVPSDKVMHYCMHIHSPVYFKASSHYVGPYYILLTERNANST